MILLLEKELPLEKLTAVEQTLAADCGPFSFFALALREDSPDRWDLLVSAPWISASERDALKRIANAVTGALSDPEILKISRIVILNKSDSLIHALHATFPGQIHNEMMQDLVSNGLAIKYLYVFVSDATL